MDPSGRTAEITFFAPSSAPDEYKRFFMVANYKEGKDGNKARNIVRKPPFKD